MDATFPTIIPITELIRNFSRVTSDLVRRGPILITREGRHVATLSASNEEKRALMKQTAGALKGTDFGNEKIWQEVFQRKSKAPIAL
ncbi:MAG: hypothetical protein UY21_C0004G0004 [Microgenomates group bacterium GW2011_GWA1_48_10]|nr:MAG: hypothetical protein UY21_C0004G0004 [Microgenomates group bacterium GW2011_GWA1_48_10]